MLLILLFSYPSFGQDTKAGWGIKIGAGLSKPNIDYVNTVSPTVEREKFGIILGGFVNITGKKNMIIQPGVQYVRKGWKEGYTNGYQESMNYFEIPINLLFKLKERKQHFYIGAGLSPAFSATSAYRTGIKSFDLGINALAGYVLPIGFSVNLGYTHGLLNATADKNYITNIRNRYFALTAGYEF